MVTTFGLLQALVSIVQDSGDQIHCIRAGSKRIVYLLKKYETTNQVLMLFILILFA
jgi:hypothetical protein